MRIAISNGAGSFHLLTNTGIQPGDRVYPLTHGWNDGQAYYVMGLHDPKMAGFPDHPHIVLDMNYGGSKSYEVQTDKGYGPRECYFKMEVDFSSNTPDPAHE
jgi:hypothetical protein